MGFDPEKFQAGAPDTDWAVDVRVPEAGYYGLELVDFIVARQGGYADIYLDGEKVGGFNFYRWDQTVEAPVAFEPVYLDAGVHTVVFRRNHASSRGAFFYIGTIRLNIDRSGDRLRVGVFSPALAPQGREVPCPLYGFYDGALCELRGAEISAASSDASTAGVRVEGETLYIAGHSLGGSAEITVSVTHRGESRTLTIPVQVAKPDAVRSMDLVIDKTNYRVGESGTLRGAATLADGSEVDIRTLSYYYQSADTKVATVDADGVVRAVGAGTAEISAYVSQEGEVFHKAVSITVSDDSPLVSAEITGPQVVAVGASAQLGVSGLLESGAAADLSGARVSFNLVDCAPTGAAQVSVDGVLQAKLAGQAQVAATVEYRGRSVRTPALAIQLRAEEAEEPAELAELMVSADRPQLLIGQSTALSVQAYSSDGSRYTFGPSAEGSLLLESRTPDILRINQDQSVTAVGPGAGVLEAVARLAGVEKRVQVLLDVEDDALASASIALSPAQPNAGSSAQVTVTGHTRKGKTLEPGELDVFLESGDPSVLQAVGSHVLGMTPGQAELIARISIGGMDTRIRGDAQVTVSSNAPEVASAEVVPGADGAMALRIAAHSPGYASLHVRAEQDGESAERAVTVRVAEAEDMEGVKYTYDFRRQWTLYEPNGSAGDKSDMPWTWTGVSSGRYTSLLYQGSYAQFGDGAYRFGTNGSSSEYFQVRLDVPETDVYSLTLGLVHEKWCTNAASIYLAPEDAENPQDETYRLKTINTWDESADAGVKDNDLGSLRLRKGSYLLTFAMGDNSGFYLKLLSLTLRSGAMRLSTDMSVAVGESADWPLTVKLGEVAAVESRMDVTVLSPAFASVNLRAETTALKPGGKTSQLTVEGLDGTGEPVDLAGATIVYSSSDPEVLSVDAQGLMSSGSRTGVVQVQAEVSLGGITRVGAIEVTVTEGKTESTFYTREKVDAARENARSLDWAKSMQDSAVKKAEKYLGKEEFLWSHIPSQEVPRGLHVGYRYDPDYDKCRYCGENLVASTGLRYPWMFDVLSHPWKLQCPVCRRRFPSNDFGGFYELGLDEHGNFRIELARARNQELVAQGQDGYLENVLYPEMEKAAPGWGVDDGYGYHPGRTNPNGIEEVHTYIAYYNQWAVWYRDTGGTPRGESVLFDAMGSLRDAYLYTGEARYGRVCAMMIDRIADLYPDMSTAPFYPSFYNNDSSQPKGKALGCTSEADGSGVAQQLAKTYDAVYPMFEDPAVVRFLSRKAEKYQLENTKQTPRMIRENCEERILREIYRGAVSGDIHGNFGMHQYAVSVAARVLDTRPDTGEMLDWVFRSGYNGFPGTVNAGNLIGYLIENVNRDGLSIEGSAAYNNTWIINIGNIAGVLAQYPGYESADLYQNPLFVKMIAAPARLTLAGKATAQIGDSDHVATTGLKLNANILADALRITGNPLYAQLLYKLNGDSAEGLHYDIFTRDPERLSNQVRQAVDAHGEYRIDYSDQLAGAGFSILRAGEGHPAAIPEQGADTQRDFWLHYGRGKTGWHSHPDALNLGIEAYGLNFAPDMGYPEAPDGGDKYTYWTRSTIAHNTVQVNDVKQPAIEKNGFPLHFDDAGMVRLMDVDAKNAYPGVTDIYRRTVVMVDVDDTVSYGVDFFRVKGGGEHVYSFHALSDEVCETGGLAFVSQSMGSYAGPDVPWGSPRSSSGYSWLKNVERAVEPGSGPFFIDFQIKDFRDTLPGDPDLHLRMTMLNAFPLSEVALADGVPPQIFGNPETLKFVLARRSGTNLDSLFTTVFEPYESQRTIASIREAPMEWSGGAWPGEEDTQRAVRVELAGGRVDYIVYASNPNARYTVDGRFDFQGFAGVCMLSGDQVVYSYLNDGAQLGELRGAGAYTGSVVDFTREIAFENQITFRPEQKVELDALIGQYVYIEDDGQQNAVFPIRGAERLQNGDIRLDIGDVTTIRGLQDSMDLDKGFTYNLAEGRRLRIPLGAVADTAPVWEPAGDKRVAAGSALSFAVRAASPRGAGSHLFRSQPASGRGLRPCLPDRALDAGQQPGGKAGDRLGCDRRDFYQDSLCPHRSIPARGWSGQQPGKPTAGAATAAGTTGATGTTGTAAALSGSGGLRLGGAGHRGIGDGRYRAGRHPGHLCAGGVYHPGGFRDSSGTGARAHRGCGEL